MPEQVRTFLSVYLAKKNVGNASKEDIYFKYTWFGSGYLSNTYFKQIANKPMYSDRNRGGDQTFTDCDDFKSDFDVKRGQFPLWYTYANWSTGDLNGNPIANNGW